MFFIVDVLYKINIHQSLVIMTVFSITDYLVYFFAIAGVCVGVLLVVAGVTGENLWLCVF